MRVALVDDDPILGRMYREVLEREGYKVDHYSDGEKALVEIFKTSPDLILSDKILPQMSGLEIFQNLKKNPKTKKIPFVFLTNLSESDDDIQRGLRLGAKGYLLKTDMTPKEIIIRIKQFIGTKRKPFHEVLS